MKTLLILLSLGLLSQNIYAQNIYAQNINENTLSSSFTRDTMLQPDYYIVNISVAEKIQYIKKGRKFTSYLLNLDSVSRDLKSKLVQEGFTQELKKVSIDEYMEQTSYYYTGRRTYDNQVLLQVTYEFIVSNKDSVISLFNRLNRENVKALVITPKLLKSTIDKAEEDLTNKALVHILQTTKNIADSMNRKIIKQSTLNIHFRPIIVINSQPKLYFSFDMNAIGYKFDVYYNYLLGDK